MNFFVFAHSCRNPLRINQYSNTYRPCIFFFLVPGIGAPIHAKDGHEYCPIRLCYKYIPAEKCAKSAYIERATHECESVSKNRLTWKCKYGYFGTTIKLSNEEPIFACPCTSKRVSSPLMQPVKEVHPNCHGHSQHSDGSGPHENEYPEYAFDEDF